MQQYMWESAMRVWVMCFVVFFGATELYQWVRGLTLPLPVFMVLGGLLAIASNADKWGLLRRAQPSQPVVAAPPAPPPMIQEPNAPVSFTIAKRKSPSLPVFNEEKGA
jgi:hypothetical protein